MNHFVPEVTWPRGWDGLGKAERYELIAVLLEPRDWPPRERAVVSGRFGTNFQVGEPGRCRDVKSVRT